MSRGVPLVYGAGCILLLWLIGGVFYWFGDASTLTTWRIGGATIPPLALLPAAPLFCHSVWPVGQLSLVRGLLSVGALVAFVAVEHTAFSTTSTVFIALACALSALLSCWSCWASQYYALA